ncbi:MAG: mechanosensitive ion channel protein MscS [Halomonadaceae bacterium]|nr:MAG: mechanosensitive ion channel protein MscS [Halomonadaceae bacterium]
MTLMLPLSAQAQESVTESAPSYSSLADMLEDDQARDRLVGELRALAAGQEREESPAVDDEEAAPSGQSEEEISFARRIANTTQGIATNFTAEFSSAVEAVRNLGSTGATADMAAITLAAFNMAMVILATVVLYILFRRLARPLFASANRWAKKDTNGHSLLRQSVAVIASALVDFLVILLAYIGGFLVALFVIGEPGEMDARESLFLNAFLVIEVFKALLRVLFASRDDGLRVLPLTGEQAAYWNAWLARLSGFIGYGILLLVPMVNFNLSPALGRIVALVIMVMAFLYALVIIMQNKQLLTERLETQAKKADLAFSRILLSMFAKSWYVLAIGYFAALVIVTVARPEDALPFMLAASLQTLIAVGGGLFLSLVLSQLITRGFKVPEETRVRYPMLENRLNSFVPSLMKAIRLLIMVVVVGLVMDAWALFSLAEWVASEGGSRALTAAISVTLIIAVAMVAWIGMASWIEQRLNPETGGGAPSAREKTLLSIFRNAIAITLIIMTLMVVLAEIGINIGPLIAGAGVLGLAIGFGSQKLVQDIITGVFIQLENAVNVGDIVTAGGVTGTTEKLTIRSLGIRDLSGTYHMIPFSSIDNVANYMRDFAYHVGVYGVAYREDIDEVIARLRDAFAELISDPEQKAKILDDIEVHGVTALADSSIDIRIRIKTLPGVQWAVGRAYNRLVKYHLDAAGIEIPFPHMTMYFGQDKDGTAPPAPVLLQQPKGKSGDKSLGDHGKEDTNAKFKGDFDDGD